LAVNPQYLGALELNPIAVGGVEAEARSSASADTRALLALLYRQVRALAGPREDLDDLVQLAAERVLRSFDRFQGRCALPTWTYAIAYRTVLDHDRWYRRWRRRFSLDDRAPERAGARDSEAELIEVERARRLRRALNRLPATKRAVVVLHDLEGVPAEQVCAIVGVGKNTLRSRLRDARLKLRELLREDDGFDWEAGDGSV
jgi:RNA polymerase sigma-70 factor (ECF subfamily)